MYCSVKAKAKYLEVGMRMRDYELQKYEHWREETEKILPLLMKRNILVVSANSADVGGSQVKCEMVCGIPPLQCPKTNESQSILETLYNVFIVSLDF